MDCAQAQEAVEIGLNDAAEKLRTARSALAQATDGAKAAAKTGVTAGMSEVATARTLGVDRITLRRWLGKQ